MIRCKNPLEVGRSIAQWEAVIRNGGDARLMSKLGAMVIDIIRDRTADGVDVNGNAFEEYSTAYAKRKGGEVNLELSGRMLKAITKKAFQRFVRVYVQARGRSEQTADSHLLALVHNFGMRSGRGKGFQMPQREFFGISDEEKELIAKVWKESVLEEFKRMRGGA